MLVQLPPARYASQNRTLVEKILSQLREVVSEKSRARLFEYLEFMYADLMSASDYSMIEAKKDTPKFSYNSYNEAILTTLIENTKMILSPQDKEFRLFCFLLLHHSPRIRSAALSAMDRLLKLHPTNFPSIVYEIVLSSLLVDVKGETTADFASLLVKQKYSRLLEYLTENLFYAVRMSGELLGKEKEIYRERLQTVGLQALLAWEKECRFRLMIGENITKLVVSANCGEFLDALSEGKGVIDFITCAKALCHYGDSVMLPTLPLLLEKPLDLYHKKWIALLLVLQGKKEYLGVLRKSLVVEDKAFVDFARELLPMGNSGSD